MAKSFFKLVFLIYFFINLNLFSQPVDYVWDNLPVGGGGYVTGIVIHPLNKNIIYIRTDVGGAYSWDIDNKRWIQMLNWVGPDNANLIGVDGMAVDPNNVDRVYLALGKDSGSSGGVYRSDDKGKTWKKLFSANYDGNGREARWIGECIAVDPNNSNIIYAGTRLNGLHRSTNDGVSWSKISSVPNGYTGTNPTGVRTIVFDPSEKTEGNSAIIYAGVPGSGIYRSTDAGSTFARMEGSPVNPARMQVVNRELFVTHSSGVSLWTGTEWKNITPSAGAGKNYVALAVDPENSNRIVTAERYGAFYNAIYRTTNKGASWTHINSNANNYTRNVSIPWWNKTRFSSATAGMAMVPGSQGEVYYTDWFGVWYTPDVWATKTEWYTLVAGHEETVVLLLVAPPSGALVYSGMADNFGFRHEKTDEYPKKNLYNINEGFSIAVCEQAPQNIAILGAKSWGGDQTILATSGNFGDTWTNRTLPQGTTLGKIAVSSTNPDNMVYVAGAGAAYYTTDRGMSWSLCKGAPDKAIRLTDIWNKDFALAADMVNGNKFYLFKSGILYASTDGGANWTAQNSTAIPNFSGYLYVVPAPGIEGEVWIALDGNGLWRTSDGGKTFSQIPNFPKASLFTWGAPAPDSDIPTAYCYGKRGNKTALYRSTDMGNSLIQINDDEHQFPAGAKALAGDRQTFGRIFIGSGGCGIFYGQLSATVGFGNLQKHDKSPDFKIFPNPNSGYIFIQLAENILEAKYEIYDSIGKIIKTGYLGSITNKIEMNNANKGLYYIRISSANLSSTEKIIFN